MMTFLNEQNENLYVYAKGILKDLAGEQDIRDILAKIYTERMKGKSWKQGQAAADAILKGINKFEEDYQEAWKDPDSYIERFQEEMDAGKSCVERCNYWIKMSAALSAATIITCEGDSEREQMIREIESLEIPEEMATPEREQELRIQVMEAVKNSGIVLESLEAQVNVLQEMAAKQANAGILINIECKETEYRAVLAMLVYTTMFSGETENIPVEIMPEQVAENVCAKMEQIRIIEEVRKGDMAVDDAMHFLEVLAVVVSIAILYFIEAGVGKTIFIGTDIFLMQWGIFAFWLGIMSIVYVLYECILKDGIIRTLVTNVVKTIERISDFIKAQGLPGMVEKAKEIFSNVTQYGLTKNREAVYDRTILL